MKISQLRLQMIIREELQLHFSGRRLLREDGTEILEWAALGADLAALAALSTGIGAPAAGALTVASSALDVTVAIAKFHDGKNVAGVFNLLSAVLPAFPAAPALSIFNKLKGSGLSLYKAAPPEFIKIIEVLVTLLLDWTAQLIGYLDAHDDVDVSSETETSTWRMFMKDGLKVNIEKGTEATRDGLETIQNTMVDADVATGAGEQFQALVNARNLRDVANVARDLAGFQRKAYGLDRDSRAALLKGVAAKLGVNVSEETNKAPTTEGAVRISRGQLRRIIREELCDHRRSQ